MRLQILPPSLRQPYRYVVFEIISKTEVSFEDIVGCVWRSVLGLFGEAGASEIMLWVPKEFYNAKKKRGMIRSTHHGVEMLRAALASIKDINGEPAIVVVLGVTGTMRSAKDKFLGVVDLKSFAKNGTRH